MTDTPVPADFNITWSFSSLNSYQTCPRKWWAEKVAKTADNSPGAAAQWGLDVHTALEVGGRDGVPLPSNMVQYQQQLDNIVALQKVADFTSFEHQLAVTRESAPCEWSAPEAFGRCIADVLFTFGDKAVVVDWKTGKYRGPTLQAVINAKLAMDHMHHIQRVETRFIYLKERVNDAKHFDRHTVGREFNPVGTLVDQLTRSVETQSFPTRPNGLCRQYCGDFSCPHNGRAR